MTDYHFTSIATIHSCYKEKFGIPRQPNLVANPATIEMNSPYSQTEAFRELESFSHIWVFFVFHGITTSNWKLTVRPPRLGGNKRVGVFASRSMFRPNPIGLSVVELKCVERKKNKIILHIVGGDFLDSTPVLDIKPYLPYVDAVNSATGGYAEEKPEKKFHIVFSPEAKIQLERIDKTYPHIEKMISDILQLDPRPAYKQTKKVKKQFAIRLYDYDIKWRVEDTTIFVTSLATLKE